MKTQSKKRSLIESLANVFAGMVINLIAQIIIFNAYGITATLNTNIQITAIFTALAIVRTYAIRRIFEKGITNK
jgi:hypothetical protein